MRIWYQSMTDLDRVPGYARVLREHVAAAGSPDVTVEVHGVAPGTYGGRAPMEVLRYPLGFHRALAQVLDNVESAPGWGFDAFLMGSFVAPLLREARSAVAVPVTSMTESVLLTARSLSRRVGLVCINEHQVGTTTDLIGALGLDDHYVVALPIDVPADEATVSAALDTTAGGGELLEAFLRACRSAADAGADLVVPAEGILSEAARTHGVTAVDDVPVLDCVEVAIAHTAMLARLLRSGAAGVGRRYSYPMAP
jgi:Asp/Glu/hydantoin racemase